jgi:AmmeMemoRadiSam system protein B
MITHDIRPPAVAGRFFPARTSELNSIVDACLREARHPSRDDAPKAIIAPHAGFVFSGPIAGSAFASLAEAADRIQRVVLIGPSHHVAFEGVATSGYANFETPLGVVPVDVESVRRALEFEFVHEDERAHRHEHSLETHLPFLQRVLGDFSIVPLVTGQVSKRQLSELLEALWGGDETIVSVSSDLSHFFDYDTARQLDGATSEAIVDFDADRLTPDGACGAIAIRGLLESGRRRQMQSEMIDVRNSGDTAGDRNRVVGYGAYAFWE